MVEPNGIALYIHVPFCATKCPYCDFNTYASIEGLMKPYIEALRREIIFWSEVLQRPKVSTVFFGGGTPSYLNAGQLTTLVQTTQANFDLDPAAEVTVEANPEDLTDRKLAEFSTAGVNRLSIGVQSLDDKLLKTLGRRHDATEAEEAVTRALAAGFENLSIDLMYGLSDQKLQQWNGTLDRALNLGCHHISMYALTLEPGTPMQKAEASGYLNTPDPDLAADMYLAAEARMGSQGYRHYEISNWCLPGHESKHNLTYWHNHPFLGVGPGAHSYIDGVRFSVQRSPREYTLRLSTDPSMPEGASWSDTLREISFVDMVKGIPSSDEMAETMMMGLRLDVGVNNRHFTARFGVSLEDAYGPIIFGAQNDGLLRWTYPSRLKAEAIGTNHSDASLQLTAKGRLLGNEIFSRFFT